MKDKDHTIENPVTNSRIHMTLRLILWQAQSQSHK